MSRPRNAGAASFSSCAALIVPISMGSARARRAQRCGHPPASSASWSCPSRRLRFGDADNWSPAESYQPHRSRPDGTSSMACSPSVVSSSASPARDGNGDGAVGDADGQQQSDAGTNLHRCCGPRAQRHQMTAPLTTAPRLRLRAMSCSAAARATDAPGSAGNALPSSRTDPRPPLWAAVMCYSSAADYSLSPPPLPQLLRPAYECRAESAQRSHRPAGSAMFPSASNRCPSHRQRSLWPPLPLPSLWCDARAPGCAAVCWAFAGQR